MLVQATYYAYIITNKNNSVLYIGVTNSIRRRVYEHKTKHNRNSFSARYNCNKLIYYEMFEVMDTAIAREKELKKWQRNWKEDLINTSNAEWNDLAKDWYEGE
ncbi:MAG: GIY-YIG nuclease family protein [Bacteroidetes bacterium]|nr:GIY-YIG nuclease family protein [Bacteroidota bacterium]